MTSVERVVEALTDFGSEPRPSRGGWLAHCPAHEDRKPSLYVSEGGDGRALVLCRAGCPVGDVLAQIDLTLRDLFPDRRWAA